MLFTVFLLSIGLLQGSLAALNLKAARKRGQLADVTISYCEVVHLSSREIHINGSNLIGTAILNLEFYPSLLKGVAYDDITVYPLVTNQVTLRVRPGYHWGESPGPLLLVGVNSSDSYAKIDGGSGTKCTEVGRDPDIAKVEIVQSDLRVYQSHLRDKVIIIGKGFARNMTLTLSPALQLDGDCSIQVVSENKLELYLKDGRLWRTEPGFITVHAAQVGGKNFTFFGTKGVHIAYVLPDPVIVTSAVIVYKSQSKVIQIRGSGFTNATDMKLVLHPTTNDAYSVLDASTGLIRLQLKPGNAWLSSLHEETGNSLRILSIDTGAGEIIFDSPIAVATVIDNKIGVVCDDTCEFAFDGVCDVGGDTFVEGSGKWANACMEGTDCTDCGGIDGVEDYPQFVDYGGDSMLCTDTCMYAGDGVCDDLRGTMFCDQGESP